LVAAVRAWPPLLEAVAPRGVARIPVVEVLRRSNDYDLARNAGIDLGRKARVRGAASLLSPRERDVVELLRQGFTNAEIAKALFISPSTVKVHVEHVLEKTGARSRTEVAAMDWDV
jgi:DNA-binding NarL/FixJ family response regulator